MQDFIKEWTENTIKEQPKLYGGDNGNPAIIKAYLVDVTGDARISDIDFNAISKSVAVSRVKNLILVDQPELDCRVKNLPKQKKKSINAEWQN